MFDSANTVIVNEGIGYDSMIEHRHNFVEIACVMQGSGVHYVGGTGIKIKEGDVFVVADKNISHHIRPDDAGQFVVRNIIFPFDFFEIDYKLFPPDVVYPLAKIVDGEHLVQSITAEYHDKGFLYEQITRGLTLALLVRIMRSNKRSKSVKKYDLMRNKKQKKYSAIAEEYIEEHYDQSMTLDEIASACGICKAYLQREFRKDKGISVTEFIISYRIEKACKLLLSSSYSVSAISEMVGFNDLKYFYLKFKQIVGVTPSKFKEMDTGGANGRSFTADSKRKP